MCKKGLFYFLQEKIAVMAEDYILHSKLLSDYASLAEKRTIFGGTWHIYYVENVR